MLDPVIAKRVQLVGLDVEGVLTDGGVYATVVNGAAVEFHRFDRRDELAIRFLSRAGIQVVLVCSRACETARARAGDLGVESVVVVNDVRGLTEFEDELRRLGVRLKDCAFVGDDLPDVLLMRRVGLAVAVANAAREVVTVADYTTEAPGGRGAVREFVEELLLARGDWEVVVHHYLGERAEFVPRGIGAS